MVFSQVVNRIYRAAKASLTSNDWKKRAIYLYDQFPNELFLEGSSLKFLEFECTIPKNCFSFLLDKYETLRTLKRSLGAQLFIKDNDVFLSLHGKTFNITTSEELFIIEEIFLNGIYNFRINHKMIVVDVGMNVGFASLYFASHLSVENVYGFEPFLPTFNQAIRNFELNPKWSTKIKPTNYGLNDITKSMEVKYNYENKGQVGVLGTALIKSRINFEEDLLIHLLESSTVIAKIIKENPNRAFALKLDCEGAEYRIIENLADSGLLSKFEIIFIEWHENGPEPLLKHLEDSGFNAFYPSSTGRVGMIYGYK